MTVLAASKVLTLSTFGAVRVSPLADFAVIPARPASISTASLGSRFVISSHNLPFVSLAAIASRRGKATPPCVYQPASKVHWHECCVLKRHIHFEDVIGW